MDKSFLCEIMPIMEKAAPLMASLVKNNKLGLIVGLLAALVNCKPEDEDELAKRLKDEKDLFAKLKNLEDTHGSWLLQKEKD